MPCCHSHAEGLVVRAGTRRQLEAGAVWSTASEWTSPVVAVPGKDCSPRYFVHEQKLNMLTPSDTYLLLKIVERLYCCGEATLLTTSECS